MSQYKTGTVSVTNGSQVVTGTGTAWLSNIQPGDGFTVAGTQVPYTVGSVDSDGQITLSSPYAGSSGSALAYAIWRDFEEVTGAPELSHGDIETATIFTRAIRKIGQAIANLIPAHVAEADPHDQYLLSAEYQKSQLRESLLAEATLNLDFANNRYEIYDGPFAGLTAKTLSEIISFSRASSATARNATGGISNVLADEHRLLGNREGLLIEEQRTNLITWSEAFDNVAWLKTAATVSLSSAAAPDSSQTAQMLESTNSTPGTSGVRQNGFSFNGGQSYSVSCFVKDSTFSGIFVIHVFESLYSDGASLSLNLATGEVYLSDSGDRVSSASVKAETLKNGWIRVVLNFTCANSFTGPVFYRMGAAAQQDSILIWGAQVEQGSSASSYIKSEGAQVTRSKDTCVRALSSELNPLGSTLLFQVSEVQNNNQAAQSYIGFGTTSTSAESRINIDRLSGGGLRLVVYDSNGSNGRITNLGSAPAGTKLKGALAIHPDGSIEACINGIHYISPHVYSGVPTHIGLGSLPTGDLPMSGVMKYAVGIPRALPASELELLTGD